MPAVLSHCASSVRRTFAAHLPLYVCAVVFCLVTWAVTAIWHVPLELSASLFFLETVPVFVLLGAGFAAALQFVRIVRAREEHPSAAMGRWLKASLLSGDRPGNILHSLIVFTPLMVSFAALKNDIPMIQPFSWDETFAHWDRVLTFGHTPWEVLQPWLGHPPITAAINFIYDCWFVVMFGSLIHQAFAARANALRLQFLLAFAFSWFIAGNVLALVFSSAGPCFYADLHLPNDPYEAQMQYLEYAASQAPVWSVGIQDTLWKLYLQGNSAFGGISAMPSMHVTIAVVVMLLGWRIDRRLGMALTVFCAVIMVGAVRLAWHYLADVIAGAALGAVFWYAAGWLAMKHEAWLAARATRPAVAPEPGWGGVPASLAGISTSPLGGGETSASAVHAGRGIADHAEEFAPG
jgi:hypothetical protein